MKQDVAIIGGGVIGVACALELARRGAQVTVLEKDRVGHGCSYGNAGWLAASQAAPLANPHMLMKSFKWMLDPESPLYIQPRLDPAFARWLIEFLFASRKGKYERGVASLVELCRVSIDMWEDVARRAPETFGFERHGLLSVFEKPASLEASKASVDLAQQSGVRAEKWTADEVREKEPAIVGPQVGGYFYPDDAHCEPYRAVKALEAEARARGVQFLEGTEVYRIADGASAKRLTTTRGDISAGQIVIATGPWSESLGEMLGIRLPVIGAKGYSIVLPRTDPHPARSIYLIERKVAVNPHRDALRIAGTLELVRNDFSINNRRVNVILRGAKAMLNIGEAAEPLEIWRGLRPCTPDGMPLIGRARGLGDVWLATGHQMAGLKAAPGTGLLLAQLMSGEKPRFDPEPFRADRY
ncbi:MAG: FAD-dependent oxidoreductase [Acidobacteriota bacterium]|nr:FAD-dependent oxidoreductase [Acidobacteriota bacterium]